MLYATNAIAALDVAHDAAERGDIATYEAFTNLAESYTQDVIKRLKVETAAVKRTHRHQRGER